MNINEWREQARMLEKIGIKTAEDLARFSKEEQRQGESLKQAVKRYYNELGGDKFIIKEN